MKLFHVIATSVLGTAMALGTGFASANKQSVKRAKAYTYELVTSNDDLANGDLVVVATKSGDNPATGVSGYNGNKDATISTTESDWVQFEVGSASSSGWTLYDSSATKYIATPSANEFKYGTTGGTCSVTSSGVLSCSSRELAINNTNYRFYGSTSEYERFYVWKNTSATPTPKITLDKVELNFKTGGSAQVVTVTPASFSAAPTLSVSGVPACVSATPSGLTVSISPLAVGSGKFTITATNNTEVASADVDVSVKAPFTPPAEGDYYITATRDSTTYYMKSSGSSSAPTAVTNKEQATVFTFTLSDGKYTIKSGDNYLYCNSDNNGLRVGSTADTWLITEGTRSTGAYDMKSVTSNRYITLYNKSDFRSYTAPDATNRLENTDLEPVAVKVLQSISLSKNDSLVKKSYFNGQAASAVGLTVMATYDSGDPVDVTSSAVITPNPATVQLSTTSISYTATFSGKTSNSVTVTGITVSKANGIASIYSMSADAAVDVYGYYVGFLDGTGPVIMNGEYGVVIFAKTHDVSGYTEKETILHVTGSVSIYKGLYEIAGTVSITKVDSAVGDLDAPIVYAAKGGETADCASRLTTVTGYVAAVTSGSLTADPQAADIKMNFQVGSSTIEVFYKKAAQTSKDIATLKDSLDNSTELTVSGFTSWYNGFQAQMSKVVEAVETYTAEMFAQDLMDQTYAVCAGYVEGDNNHDAIVAIWSDLASADKYPSLPADQKAILAAADADEHSSDVVEQAMARYDFLTVRYNLNNFINGRLGGSETNTINTISHSSDLAAIIVTMSVVALVSSVGFFLVIRKRKHQ